MTPSDMKVWNFK